MFDLIAKGHRQVPHGDSLPMMLSLVLHSAVVTSVIVTSVMLVSNPVPHFRGISAFVADVPPPPPPPPPAPPTQAQTQHIEQPVSRDAAPIEMPATIEEEELSTTNVPGLDAPSVVVGGLLQSAAPDPAPPPAPSDVPRIAPVRIGGAITAPKLLARVEPVYPQFAMEARVQGVVVLETVIDAEGRVAQVRVLRSIPLLDQAAMDSVKQWRYAPVLVNGQPVPCVLTVTVTFVLREG